MTRERDDEFSRARCTLDEALCSAEDAIKMLRLGVEGAVELPECPRHRVLHLQYSNRDLPGLKMQHLHVMEDGHGIQDIFRQSLFVRQLVARAIPQLVQMMRDARQIRAVDIQADADALNEYLTEGMDL